MTACIMNNFFVYVCVCVSVSVRSSSCSTICQWVALPQHIYMLFGSPLACMPPIKQPNKKCFVNSTCKRYWLLRTCVGSFPWKCPMVLRPATLNNTTPITCARVLCVVFAVLYVHACYCVCTSLCCLENVLLAAPPVKFVAAWFVGSFP